LRWGINDDSADWKDQFKQVAGVQKTAERWASDDRIRGVMDLKKGDAVVMDDRPCKIVEKNVSKPGRHGITRARLVVLDVFTSRKMDHIYKQADKLEIPILQTQEYCVLDIDAELKTMQLLNETTAEIRTIALPQDELVVEQIRSEWDTVPMLATVLTAEWQGGKKQEEAIISARRQ